MNKRHFEGKISFPLLLAGLFRGLRALLIRAGAPLKGVSWAGAVLAGVFFLGPGGSAQGQILQPGDFHLLNQFLHDKVVNDELEELLWMTEPGTPPSTLLELYYEPKIWKGYSVVHTGGKLKLPRENPALPNLGEGLLPYFTEDFSLSKLEIFALTQGITMAEAGLSLGESFSPLGLHNQASVVGAEFSIGNTNLPLLVGLAGVDGIRDAAGEGEMAFRLHLSSPRALSFGEFLFSGQALGLYRFGVDLARPLLQVLGRAPGKIERFTLSWAGGSLAYGGLAGFEVKRLGGILSAGGRFKLTGDVESAEIGLDLMEPFYGNDYGNPSSPYRIGLGKKIMVHYINPYFGDADPPAPVGETFAGSGYLEYTSPLNGRDQMKMGLGLTAELVYQAPLQALPGLLAYDILSFGGLIDLIARGTQGTSDSYYQSKSRWIGGLEPDDMEGQIFGHLTVGTTTPMEAFGLSLNQAYAVTDASSPYYLESDEIDTGLVFYIHLGVFY